MVLLCLVPAKIVRLLVSPGEILKSQGVDNYTCHKFPAHPHYHGPSMTNPLGRYVEIGLMSPASRWGRDERGFHRRTTDSLHVAIFCSNCVRVATCCHISPQSAICCCIWPTCSHKISSGRIAALLRRPRLS